MTPSGSNLRIRRHLLALLADVPQAIGSMLTAQEWALFQRMAAQHRLEPLLHQAARGADVPEHIRQAWADAHKASAMHSLAAKATLLRLGQILDRAGIVYAALKGARLAWHAYDHPALRPMRDLDILVAPEQARNVWDALQAKGFVPAGHGEADLEHALRAHKHLPALQDPASGVWVEVHTRLFEHIAAGQGTALMFDTAALLASKDELLVENQPISFLPATETLLHLIVHSVHEHRFDNGPQALHDVATLLASAPIDWPRFWRLAREGGWLRGCQLLLAMTEKLLGPQPIDRGDAPQHTIPAELLDQASLMMLQDSGLRQDLAVQVQFASTSSRAGLFGRLFPARQVIAAHAEVSSDEVWLWRHYPSWLASRLWRTVAGAANPQQRQEAARAVAIEKWLSL